VSDFVVDASVAVKWFMAEMHEMPALRLLEGRHELLVPDLLFTEVANALWKRVRRAETTASAAVATLATLDTVRFQIHPSRPLLPLALELATRFGRTVYDSLYIAVAMIRHCPLVTADRRLHDALAGGPLRSHVLWVADVP
jgi:predicted nucleic acid-binding protein